MLTLGLLACLPALADDFPSFTIPGDEARLHALNALHRLHYGPRTQTTLWDAWLPMASLWQAVGTEPSAREMRNYYRNSLLTRKIDAEGYVATQQHRGLAHPDGWPFPAWNQSHGMGWHFSLDGDGWAAQVGVQPAKNLAGWSLAGLADRGIDPSRGLKLAIEGNEAVLSTPRFHAPEGAWPWLRMEWAGRSLPAGTRLRLEWTTEQLPDFDPARGIDLEAPSDTQGMHFTAIPAFRHPDWGGTLTGLRLRIEGGQGGEIILKSLITAVDTRHPINNAIYLIACCDYFDWTADREFLRQNLGRMRAALEYALAEFDVRASRVVVVPWVGHDGRSGLSRAPDGRKQIHVGRGVGNNYWDLLPFGGKDLQATIYLVHALDRLARLERAIAAHPEWSLENPPDRIAPDVLETLAGACRKEAQRLFWNAETGRFVGWIDRDGKSYDLGLTTLNTEMIHYGLATPEQARSIMSWLDGTRVIAGDASQAADIYHFRFAPRATVRRNIDTYVWVWSNPEEIAWGGQVQDGGAVLGFSYFDLMARLKINGPDDAWKRLREILAWFDEVQAEGGYRAYYARPGRGTLQGGGPPGGLGLDAEFFESLLVPQVMLYGFLGFEPRPGGFALEPRLPSDWPALRASRIQIQDVVLDIEAAPGRIHITPSRVTRPGAILEVMLPAGGWRIVGDASGATLDGTTSPRKLTWQPLSGRRLTFNRPSEH
jgi:hypothetical protein